MSKKRAQKMYAAAMQVNKRNESKTRNTVTLNSSSSHTTMNIQDLCRVSKPKLDNLTHSIKSINSKSLRKVAKCWKNEIHRNKPRKEQLKDRQPNIQYIMSLPSYLMDELVYVIQHPDEFSTESKWFDNFIVKIKKYHDDMLKNAKSAPNIFAEMDKRIENLVFGYVRSEEIKTSQQLISHIILLYYVPNVTFAFDWDDTLFPTNMYWKWYNKPQKYLKPDCTKIIQIIKALFEKIYKYHFCKICIISNGSIKEWIQPLIRDEYPAYGQLFDEYHVQIMSSRDKYKDVFGSCWPMLAKREAFRDLYYKPSYVTKQSLISVGDGIYEYIGSKEGTKHLPSLNLKRLKMIKSPSVAQLEEQLTDFTSVISIINKKYDIPYFHLQSSKQTQIEAAMIMEYIRNGQHEAKLWEKPGVMISNNPKTGSEDYCVALEQTKMNTIFKWGKYGVFKVTKQEFKQQRRGIKFRNVIYAKQIYEDGSTSVNEVKIDIKSEHEAIQFLKSKWRELTFFREICFRTCEHCGEVFASKKIKDNHILDAHCDVEIARSDFYTEDFNIQISWSDSVQTEYTEIDIGEMGYSNDDFGELILRVDDITDFTKFEKFKENDNDDGPFFNFEFDIMIQDNNDIENNNICNDKDEYSVSNSNERKGKMTSFELRIGCVQKLHYVAMIQSSYLFRSIVFMEFCCNHQHKLENTFKRISYPANGNNNDSSGTIELDGQTGGEGCRCDHILFQIISAMLS